MSCQYVEWQVDAVELAIVLGAVLEMVDHLQRRAERIGIGPGRFVLAMHIQYEAADRHGRVAAIMYELVPIRVAALGHVHAERGQEIERMRRGKVPLCQDLPERDPSLGAVGLPKKGVLERIEAREFFLLRQMRMVGDVIRGASEAIEVQNRLGQARLQEKKGGGKIFARVRL